MKLYVKTMGLLCFNYFTIIFSPIIWIYMAFFNQRVQSVLEKIDAKSHSLDGLMDGILFLPVAALTILFMWFPVVYGFYMIFLYLKLGVVYVTQKFYLYFSFSFLKTCLYLRNEQYVYSKMFEVLNDIFSNDLHKKGSEKYTFQYHKYEGQVSIGFFDDGLKKELRFVLGERTYGDIKLKFDITDPNCETVRYQHIPKKHDLKVFQTYFESLKSQALNEYKNENSRNTFHRIVY